MRYLLLLVLATVTLAACSKTPPQTAVDVQTATAFTLEGNKLTVDASAGFADSFTGRVVLVQCTPARSWKDLSKRLQGNLATVKVSWPQNQEVIVIDKAPSKDGRDACLVSVGEKTTIGIFNEVIRQQYEAEIEQAEKDRSELRARKLLTDSAAAAEKSAVRQGAYTTATFTAQDLAAEIEKVTGAPTTIGDSSEIEANSVGIITSSKTTLVLMSRTDDGRLFQMTVGDDAVIEEVH